MSVSATPRPGACLAEGRRATARAPYLVFQLPPQLLLPLRARGHPAPPLVRLVHLREWVRGEGAPTVSAKFPGETLWLLRRATSAHSAVCDKGTSIHVFDDAKDSETAAILR